MKSDNPDPRDGNSDADFDALIAHVKRTRGFDFTGYKHSSLMRRILKRMQSVNIDNFQEYIDYLEVHPDEFIKLFNVVLINVTNFFRDTTPWHFLASDIIPLIIDSKKPGEPIRAWSAGCASGEEAYTIAIMLAEALGIEKFKERVKIYASDVDEEALTQARQASYTYRELNGIPEPLIEKYFENSSQRYVFQKDLRRSVIFGRHDLLQDAPISRIDLLVCRNVLMYFNAEAQAKILSRFHFALNDTGFLFLGKAEMLFTHAALFRPIDLKRRIFVKVPQNSLRERLFVMSQGGNDDTSDRLARHIRFREVSFDAGPVAQTVFDLNGFLVLANEQARLLLNLHTRDLGRPLHELELFYRIPELKAQVERVYTEQRLLGLKDVNWATMSGDMRILSIHITPLLDGTNTMMGASVTFADITTYKRLQEELEQANQELETAYEELQSTNEELETTNEELQSTVEELETTNEELQSTNEELETINEELQSSNEELETVNEELRRRTEEINQINAFLESILASLQSGVVVVDQDIRVQVWSLRAEDLWGLRASEVQDKNFLNLDIGLPVEQLKQPIRDCLSRESPVSEMILNATNRRGKPIFCKVTCTPLQGSLKNLVSGVILLMEEVDHP